MDRTQLDEATYLQQFGVAPGEGGSVLHPASAAALAAAPAACASCARLQRAREGAAAHLASLTRALHLAEEEASAHLARYRAAKAVALRVWCAATGGL